MVFACCLTPSIHSSPCIGACILHYSSAFLSSLFQGSLLPLRRRDGSSLQPIHYAERRVLALATKLGQTVWQINQFLRSTSCMVRMPSESRFQPHSPFMHQASATLPAESIAIIHQSDSMKSSHRPPPKPKTAPCSQLSTLFTLSSWVD